MTEFWEANFAGKKEMWGMAPAPSALMARDIFVANGAKTVLVPGMGYGRNAQVFADAGIAITGIEISQTAIAMARQHYGSGSTIYHGSVAHMPYDNQLYDGIFCYSLIHLLDTAERHKLIADCYRQLSPGGTMIFVAITTQAHTYGQGTHLGPNRYETFPGVQMYFYDHAAIRAGFAHAGLTTITEVQENYPFFFVTCRKTGDED